MADETGPILFISFGINFCVEKYFLANTPISFYNIISRVYDAL